MKIVEEYKDQVATTRLCEAFNLARPSFYRHLHPPPRIQLKGEKLSARRLSLKERDRVLEVLHSERFMDLSPAEVFATLLDEGHYLCSVRSMYRILSSQGENKERRDVVCHRDYQRPELLATGPNQVWSWDITKLLGPEKWTYFYLYVLLDIFSRYVVGWMVAPRESGHFARALIEETLKQQNIKPGELIIHSDRGSPMKSKPVAFLYADLGITKSFSRPHVSNDNPFSEAQFKTLKYCPQFPERFGSQQDATLFCRRFFSWYNAEHKHSALQYYSPEDVHYHRAQALRQIRNQTLNQAYLAHPERFVHKPPTTHDLPRAVWINPPAGPMEDKNKNLPAL